MSAPEAGSVLLVLSSTVLGEGLAGLLRESGITDIREAVDLSTAKSQLRHRPAQLTLCGSELDQDRIGQLVVELLDCGSSSVVVLSPTIREPDMLAALQAGALGYVSRDESLDRLVYDIHGALRGEACLPRDRLAPVLRLLIERKRLADEQTDRIARLSKREVEVLNHLVAGAENEQIAGALFLSQATVRTHIQNILKKLEVHSRLEAIALVQECSASPALQPPKG